MRRHVHLAALCLLSISGCRRSIDYNEGNIEFSPDRPEVDEPIPSEPYEGDDPIVIEAQSRFATGLELHQKVIWRTCTPNGGVCHNSKEYPDLRTPGNFAAAFGAACNVQPGEFSSVFDGCEQPGDRVRFGDAFEGDAIQIAWIERIDGDDQDYGDDTPPEDAPGLHLHLATPLASERDETYTTARLVRTFVDGAEVKDIVYASYRTRWWKLGDGTHLLGQVAEYQRDDVEELLAVGIREGDANRNGILGATGPTLTSLLVAGRPEDSYLIARIRGEMHDAPIPGSRMPLANAPLTVPEMLALFCLVEGWQDGAESTYLAGPIDYANCSFSEDPEALNLLGNGVTWASRVQPILEANCGGCHSGEAPEGGLALVGEGVYARLLEPSTQLPELALVQPGDAEQSYLYLKLTGGDAIVGSTMPYNPLTGEGRLSEAELGDILTWIANGAVEDQ
jgi:hypothetical protein